MVIDELGQLEGEILIFGGPYSNAQALDAVLTLKGSREAICTGDVVAYCADPEACVQMIKAANVATIAGNCEKQLAGDAPDCGCGFDAGSACDLLSVQWYGHARAQISALSRRWMADLPDVITFEAHGHRYGVLHGGLRDVARFVWETSPEAVFAQEISDLQQTLAARGLAPVDRVIAGHCGLPFQRRIGAVLWINPGVIGMPPHDGKPQTRFGILSAGGAQFHHLDYDWRGAQQAMASAGLVGYGAALQSGYWPSEDILPASLRRANG